MKEKDRDIFDDIFRSKLQNFESDTMPDDWEAIVNRLPDTKIFPLRKRWPYWAAAAVSFLLLISGAIYISRHNNIDETVVEKVEKETQKIESQIIEDINTPQVPPVTIANEQPVTSLAIARRSIKESLPETNTDRSADMYTYTIAPDKNPAITINRHTDITAEEINALPQRTAVASHIQKEKAKTTPASRKWGFGMGAGGFTEGTGYVVNTYVLRANSLVEDEKLLSLNALSDAAEGKEPKSNIKHKTPISFGFAVSRELNSRFALQTGLTYSFLTSDWETNASTYNKEIRQRLHFVGIPLSLTYRIADVNRFRFYTSAGALAEVNVAGKERTKSFFADQQTNVTTTSVRMKEWQWSVNARAGVSYPIIRYVNAFAEVGVAYYFDNGSEIETIYSDKSFNVSPQIGLRLNF